MLIRFLFSSLLCLTHLLCQATSVLPLQLDNLVADAGLIFQGTCTGNRSERDLLTGMIVTYTTFDVSDVLKGSAGATHTIKQAGGEVDDASYHIHGVPSFAIGREYVVFLYGASGLGFSSPVGLGQGQFAVFDGPLGKQLSNGRDLNEMMQGQFDSPGDKLAPPGAGAAETRHIGVDDFKRIVRSRIVGAR